MVAGAAAWLAFTNVAAAGTWLVLTRSYGCTELKYLAEAEKLPHVPTTPTEYADMMRRRGHYVTVGVPTGIAPDMADKAVLVKVKNENRVFVQEELCAKPETNQKR